MSRDPKLLERIADALETLRTGFALFDAEDRFIFCNQHFRYVYRSLHDIDDLIGMAFEAFVRLLVVNGEIAGSLVVRDPERWIKDRLKAHRAGTGFTTEHLTDGRWIDVKERILPDGGVIGVWTDATDRIRYRLRLESAMNCIADGFGVWDQTGRLDDFNAKFAERYTGTHGMPTRGQTFEEVMASLAFSGRLDLEGPAAAAWLNERLRERHLPERTGHLEYTDGRYFIVTESRTLEGSVVTALSDVTELKERERELAYRGQSLQRANDELEWAKEILEKQGRELVELAESLEVARQRLEDRNRALQRSEAHQHAILETMADALVVVTEAGTIETVNRHAEHLFGWPTAELIGRPVSALLPEDGGTEAPSWGRLLADGICAESGTRSELIAVRRDGTRFPAEIALADASTADRCLFVATFHDIGERKAAELALKRSNEELEHRVAERTAELVSAKEDAELANRAKSVFLANMSHELRTPLNAILGFSSVMQNELFAPLGCDKYREYVTDIYRSGTHLLDIINDILDMSKIEAGKYDLRIEFIDVPTLIEESMRMIEGRARDAGVRMVRRLANDLPPVRADGRAVKQVLINLLSNAVKFTGVGGSVVVAVDAAGGAIRFSVSDTGVGIANEDLPRVVQPFVQVEREKGHGHEGTGLGLPLSKKLIEAHGGRLDIASEPGRGTTVTVHLPIAPR